MTLLESLASEFPLPTTCSPVESFFETFRAGQKKVTLVGLACAIDGRTVTASAGGVRAERRAYFELVERTSLLTMEAAKPSHFSTLNLKGKVASDATYDEVFPTSDAPDLWRPAKSNGVAVHDSWRGASRRAIQETLERDRILRSWFGGKAPEALDVGVPYADALSATHETKVFRFAAIQKFEVVGVFWFPRDAVSGTIAYGFACRKSVREAVAAAASEGIQRLGFLTGEALPETAPQLAPSPAAHQEWFLFPPNRRYLDRWLSGGMSEGRELPEPRLEATRFVDLTPEALRGRLYVVKALLPSALELRFGEYAPYAPEWPKDLLAHPIA